MPPPQPADSTANVRTVDTELLAAVNRWPSPGQIPDVTAGLGAFGYDISQTVVDFVARAVVENFNLGALAAAAGRGALGDPGLLLDKVIGRLVGEIPIDLAPVFEELVGKVVTDTVVLPVLQFLGITDAQGVTDLLTLLGAVGLDLSDLLHLGNLDIPGLNVVTAGPAFTMLKLLGAGLGWAPSLPNSVAADIDATDYFEVGSAGLLATLLDELSETLPEHPLVPLLEIVLLGLGDLLPDLVNLRMPTAVGIGMGAFAIATGYDKVLADLASQPGGSGYGGLDPLLGSLTVLPMLLLLNPARPNGGAIARFYPLFDLLGIDAVNPQTAATSSGGLMRLPLGLSLGGANLVPVLIDIGVQYHPLSDLAAWPNPFSLANNLMAGLLPTYMLRGLDAGPAAGQLRGQLGEAFDDLVDGELALNLYATLTPATQPLLEPLYLLSDVISILTFGLLAVNPVLALANALAPAVEALNNLGYTDVVRNPDGTYTRTLTEGGVPTPFLSFPSRIDPLQVTVDVVNLLIRGFSKEFFSGNPTPAPPNAILNLVDYLTGKDLRRSSPLSTMRAPLEAAVGDLFGDGNLPGLPQPPTDPDVDAADTPSDDVAMLASAATGDVVDDEDVPEPTSSGATETVSEDVAEEPTGPDEAPEDDEETDEDQPDADASEDSTDATDTPSDSDESADEASDPAA
ncbi:AAA family ATPase [Mycolicibacterium pulveris]|uniref:AAA family ATPase n=1 Tax=Mycolicibacterium pulveris TaxID=36813 RepID=UPI003CF7C73B